MSVRYLYIIPGLEGSQAVEKLVNIIPTIAYRNKIIKTNSLLPIEVDQLISECRELISPTYVKWFTKRFYCLNRETIIKCASEARVDARTSPERLFSYLIGKEYAKVMK